ncbi:MAG: UDP-N-acetylglucosamine 2-epimerase [Oscillospiraceae bacterium]
MRKNICVVTGSRAEYGLLRPLISKIRSDNALNLQIAVTGMHLSEKFGLTYREIEEDNYPIHAKIEMLQDGDGNEAMSKAIGAGIIRFAEYFSSSKPDFLIVLGDRFEIFAAATAAAVAHVPIAHIYGGESTEGAIDECFRHSITKMSYLHFTAAEQYRKRVIQMGEDPKRVFNVGSLGVENAERLKLLSKEELSCRLNFNLDKPFCLVTFHPATMENDTAGGQFSELLSAIDEMPDMNYIITKANADANGQSINKTIDEYCKGRENTLGVASLGVLRYLSALQYCEMVIGNSSSGIIEAPAFGKPTINIGERQKGRICAGSVISCDPAQKDILRSMKLALSGKFKCKIKRMTLPYGGGDVSGKILGAIKEFLEKDKINLKKSFYDLE